MGQNWVQLKAINHYIGDINPVKTLASVGGNWWSLDGSNGDILISINHFTGDINLVKTLAAAVGGWWFLDGPELSAIEGY